MQRRPILVLVLSACATTPTIDLPTPTRTISSAELTCDPGCKEDEICTTGNLCEGAPLAPRILSPLSTSVVPGTVNVRWANGGSADASEIAIYRERECLTLVASQVGIADATFSDLGPGPYFIRGRGLRTIGSGERLTGPSSKVVTEIFVSARRGSNALQLQPVADFDGDGKADLTIGNSSAFTGQNIYSSSYNFNQHEWLSFGRNGSVSLAGADFRLFAYAPTRALFADTGQSVGDVDGDGFSDFAAIDGQPGIDYSTTPITYPTLPVRLYYGSKDGLSQKGWQSYNTPQRGYFVGFFALGDIDADGYSDVGVVQTDDGSPKVVASVIFGGGGVPPNLRGGLSNRSVVSRLGIQERVDRVLPLGDLDGDGTTELAFLTRARQTLIASVQHDGTIVLTPLVLDGLVDVAAIGDVNGDGLADIGANRERTQSNINDRLPRTAVVLFGGSDLLSYARAREIDYPVITSQQYDCSRPEGWQWGDAPLCIVVGTLSGGSDINHDGNPDVFMTGAVEISPTGSYPYRHFSHVWVYQGIESNTQKLSSVLELANPDDELNLYDSYFGKRGIASVGDVTGDGIDDVAIASGAVDEVSSGRQIYPKVRVYAGSEAGLISTPKIERSSWQRVDLANGFGGTMLSLGQ